jgi:RNA polymerase sigma-70 factor (ECF subfamily)
MNYKAVQVPSYKEEFKTLVLPYLNYLYRVAFCLVHKNRHDAEDLVQEAIVKAYENFHQLKDKNKCRPWLTSILYNLFKNKYRKSNKFTSVHFEESMVYEEVYGIKFIEERLDQEVSEALFKLPEAYSTVLILSDIENLPYQEIAEILEVPIGTIRSRLSRARRLLKTQLYNYAREKGYIK